jgi:hypothetical protein
LQPSPRITVAGLVLALTSGMGLAQSAVPASRGQLLYDTHCVACHDRQVHWRDAKQVTNWATLVAQVRRWQAVARLAWSDDDIRQVARHLNATFYGFAEGTLAQRE